jgi:pSer/pThr/pTyr-binding forkhead associated (FHA) protein
MAKLIFTDQQFGGRVYEFALPKTTIGRGDHNTLTIRDNAVSQTHCEILVFGPEVIVRDLGSSNGTVVNGERLHNQQRSLLAGQIVKFGSITARLELEESSSDTTTDETAIHSYAQYLREQHNEPKSPANADMTLQSASEATPIHHTLLLPRSLVGGPSQPRAT